MACRDATPIDFSQLAIGTVLSVMPHHVRVGVGGCRGHKAPRLAHRRSPPPAFPSPPMQSCATCAMHNFYYVIDSVEDTVVREVWRPCRGW